MEYRIGEVKIPKDLIDWDTIATACTLALSECRCVFGKAVLKGESAILPFAGAPSAEMVLKRIFAGCSVASSELTPNIANKKSMELAMRIDSSKGGVVTEGAIKPKGTDELKGIIGRSDQVREIESIAKAVAAYGRSALGSCHMVFTGNPGVGKTMMARLLLSAFDEAGVTAGNGAFVDGSASELVSQYVGETPKLVKQAFDRAEGGILFIDEAYRLSKMSAGESNVSHGQEAIDAINQLMEERKDDVIVVFAGYPDEMDDFLKANPGLMSRVGFQIDFPDYAPEDLAKIFASMCESRGFDVDDDALELVEKQVPELKKLDGFGNARTMRKLLDRAIVKKSDGGILDGTITIEDVSRALECNDFQTKEKTRIMGF